MTATAPFYPGNRSVDVAPRFKMNCGDVCFHPFHDFSVFINLWRLSIGSRLIFIVGSFIMFEVAS